MICWGGGQHEPYPKLSIIIPVYNTERWLRRCLDSCVNQEDVSAGNYEIIAVNDGSTDGSGVIIDEYSSAYPELVDIIHQENKGLAVARNRGMQQARGEYLWFVDSDDWVTPSAVKRILDATAGKPDGVAISYQVVFDDRQSRDVIMEQVATGVELLRRCNHNPAQFCIFRRQFLEQNGLRFLEGHFHEDVEFSSRAKYLAGNINTISEPLYFFYQRPVSISRGNKSPKRAFDCIDVCRSLHSFTGQHVSPSDKDVFGNAIATVANIGFSIIASADPQTRNKYIKELRRDLGFVYTMMKASKRFHRLGAHLLRCSPRLFLYLYAQLRR